jgi:hypothetical protein
MDGDPRSHGPVTSRPPVPKQAGRPRSEAATPMLPTCSHARHSSSTTCWPGRPSALPAALGHGDLVAQDAGQQAPLVGVEDGPNVQGHHRHAARATQVPASKHPTQRQEATGRTVRRYPLRRQKDAVVTDCVLTPENHPPQGAGHSAAGGSVRDLRQHGRHPGAPRPTARRPRPSRTTTAHVGGPDGTTATQDPGGLPVVSRRHPCWAAIPAAHAAVTGERRAVKVACAVRAGAAGEGPAPRAPTRSCWGAAAGGVASHRPVRQQPG